MSLLRNIKIKYLVLFVVVCIITFVYSYFLLPLHGDEIWCYGFSYNIASGLIPYRDFNLLQTPLYFFVGSLFVKILGNYLFSIHILNAILISLIMVMAFKMMRYKAFLLYSLFLVFLIPSYNYCCLFFLFLIIYLIHNKKDNDLILGFIVGLVFLTKQSVGIVMLLPLLFYSKNKIKSIFCFVIPMLLFGVYLIWNDALFQFIDYCFLGMFDFGDSNTVISVFTWFELIQIIYIGIILLKKKFKDKVLFYILVFQVMSYPIFDLYHWVLSFIPFFYYILKNFDYKRVKVINGEFFSFIFIILIFILCLLFRYFTLEDNHIFKDNESYFYLKNISNIDYISLVEQEKIIDKYLTGYDDFFFLFENTYLLKLYMDLEINKYDLLLDGNMGYNGEVRYIKEINNTCKDNDCVFFVKDIDFENEYCQFSREIYDYVIDNYELIDSYDYFDVYSN